VLITLLPATSGYNYYKRRPFASEDEFLLARRLWEETYTCKSLSFCWSFVLNPRRRAQCVFAALCPQSLITFDIIGTERWLLLQWSEFLH